MTGRRKLAADAWGALLQTHAALVPALDKELVGRYERGVGLEQCPPGVCGELPATGHAGDPTTNLRAHAPIHIVACARTYY